jgi:hypothetical protein
MTDPTDVLIERIRAALCLETCQAWQLADAGVSQRTLKPSADSPARLYLRTGYGARSTRLEVSGSARVHLPRGGYLYGVKHPSATFSTKRDPRAIAKDIVRRILPDLRALVVAYEKAAAEQLSDDQNVASYVDRLIAGAPSVLRKATGHTTTTSASTTLYTYNAGSYGQFTVHPSSDVKLELSSVRLATAIRIAELLEADAAKDRDALAAAQGDA